MSDFSSIRAIDWNLDVVCSQSMSMSVRIRKESSLEHFISRWFNTRYKVSRWKSTLFSFSKVVFRVSVEDHFSYWNQWIICLRPNFGYIKNIPFIISSISLWHNLNFNTPASAISIFDVVEQISSSVIWIISFKLVSFFSW